MAVADVFDALVHERPYKEAWPVERAVAEIAKLAGVQFDPDVAHVFAGLDHDALMAPIVPQVATPEAEPMPVDGNGERLQAALRR